MSNRRTLLVGSSALAAFYCLLSLGSGELPGGPARGTVAREPL